MGHWSMITTGFVEDESRSRTFTELGQEVESALISASCELPSVSSTRFGGASGCFHTNCSEWFTRDDQETVELYPEALESFLEYLTFDPGAAEQLTYVAVVESENTGNSHHITVYDVGGFEPAEEVTTELCHDGFEPDLNLESEFGITHRVRV